MSSKSLSIQSNSGRNPKSQQQKVTSTSKQNAESSADELDDCGPSGLNKDKCALAMSFFANDSSGSSTKAAGSKKATSSQPAPSRKLSKKNSTDNSSSIGSTSDISLPSVQNASARPFLKNNNPVPERAYFEPEGLELPEDDDEDDSVEVFQSRAKSRRQQKQALAENNREIELEAPPVPTRSGEPKQMMLRLMKNATSIMRS